jgi:hypothetical protein
MFNKKKCPGCGEKVDKKFKYCPWCSFALKEKAIADDFGMIGKSDEMQQMMNQVKLPMGLNGIVNGLMKQIEKEMAGMNMQDLNNPGQIKPRGFKIQISTGMPKMQMVENNQNRPQVKLPHGNDLIEDVSEAERKRRSGLKRVNAKSAIRRLPEGIIYEIETPGVETKNDVAITKLEQGMELKAYSKDKCYVKTIPMKVEIVGISVKDDKIFLRLKG